MKRFLTLLLMACGLLFSEEALASHFRYGTISWRVPDPQNAPLTVQFTVSAAWRASFIDSTDLQFGDGNANGAQMGAASGTGVDASGNAYAVQEYTATHTYAMAGNYTVFFENCCRIAGLQNGANGNFRVETIVGLASGNTAGPVTASPPIIQMQVGNVRQYTFPMFDADGDAVTCRFATAAESGLPAGSVIPAVPASGAQPSVASAANGCQITWNLTQAVVPQQYVIHLVMESTHGGATSNTAIDLIVEMVTPPPPTCVVGGTASSIGTFITSVGTPFSQMVTGSHNLATNLTLGALNVPVGATLTPGLGSSGVSPYSTTLAWTPNAASQGTTQIVVVNFTNALNLTGSCFLTLQTPQCANYGQACTVGVGACQTSGTNICAGPGVTVCGATPGQPSAETCDNIDNDCDGMVDDGNPGAGAACTTSSQGVCSVGTTTCAAGGMVQCVPNIMPGTLPEICDNLDNDCDGLVDDGNPGSGMVCVSGLPGACSAGLTSCVAGGVVCQSNVQPGAQMESCDAIDNDCDNSVDEGFGLGMACSNGIGACATTGMVICNAMGGTTCNAVPGSPTPEVCDNIDNDCDAMVDDGNPGSGMVCVSGLPGACSAGLTSCVAGGVVCQSNVQPGAQMESCDAIDNDCDSSVDEGFGLGMACSNGIGACAAAGMVICNAMGGTTCNAVPGTPTPEVCGDGIDNDCNGTLENGCVDSDGDGIFDIVEVVLGTDPNDADSDDDGVIDGLEFSVGEDSDGDGLINGLDPDSDNDGLFDGTEVGKDCSNPATDPSAGNCIPDGDMGMTTTDPTDADTDNGGVSDGSEDTDRDGVIDAGETDPTPTHGDDDNQNMDSDGDGLSDSFETQIGTDPNDADSDDDGVIDGQEPNPAVDSDGDGVINALDPDSDNDGLFDGTEMGKDCSNPATDPAAGTCVPDGDMGTTTTSPLDSDTDNGGVSDGSEDVNGNGVIDAGETDPTTGNGADDNQNMDSDGDGLTDDFETQIGTDPNDADSDDDGVIDGQEPNPAADSDGDGVINGLDPDSDNDGLFDGTEMGQNCSNPATDPAAGTCIPDGDMGMTTTSPIDPDTDNGGVNDGSEDTDRDGVIDAGETDPTVGHGADDNQNMDSDGDGLSDDLETQIGTDPNDADSDDDGVTDGQEPNPAADTDGDGLIDALDPDSDNDGLFDGTEMGLDCSNPATNPNAGNCIPDGDKGMTTTSPIDPDTDNGGVTDGSEDIDRDGVIDAGETDPTAGHGSDDNQNPDTDGDGLSNDLETSIGTDPNDADSDNDGVIDGLEPNPADDTDGDGIINALDPDSDGDGILDGTEMGFDCSNPATDPNANNCIPDGDKGMTTTSPVDPDTDNGGTSDGNEDLDHDGVQDPGETDPTTGHGDDDIPDTDADNDGLSDMEETTLGTDPTDADSDNDGVSDGEEPSVGEDSDNDGIINGLDPDSDNDGIFDGTEVGNDCMGPGTDVNAGNCIADGDAGMTTTDPLNADTDGGSVSDGKEDANHNGVVDLGETNPTAGNAADDLPPECRRDADCGDINSGKVCNDTFKCQDGCRGTDGNACKEALECSSTTNAIGICREPVGIYPSGNGWLCTASPANDNDTNHLWLPVAAGLIFAMRRRRR